jgi:biofilm protein TabA
MIHDTLAHASLYEALSPRFAAAFAYLRTVDGSQPLGRHDIDGDDCFALVQTYSTKLEANALFEAHRRYIDIQYVHSGRETILWAPLATMAEQTLAYTPEKEAALWKLVPEASALRMSSGHFAILYPQDAHAPCVQWDGPSEVFKVVIKVAVD